MKLSNVILLFAMLLVTGLCRAQLSFQNAGLEQAKKEIATSNAIYFQSFSKGDSSIFINRYAKDCWIMAPNMPALSGVEAPITFWRKAYKEIGLRDGKFITIDVFGDGKEYVTEIGYWQSFDANHRLFDHGKFLVLWKKTAKGWKMFRDSFSSDQPKPDSTIAKN